MHKPKRPSADKTRAKILAAAKAIFLENGFDAAYIKDIAAKAGVNTNLIFHHFENKEGLWQKVKLAIFAQGTGEPEYDTSSAEAFFRSVLDYRFELYSKYPELIRLIQWQQLTDNQSALVAGDGSSPNHWLKYIRRFQCQGELTREIDAKQIMLFIIFSTHAPFLQNVLPFTKRQTEQYKNMILTMCCNQFCV